MSHECFEKKVTKKKNNKKTCLNIFDILIIFKDKVGFYHKHNTFSVYRNKGENEFHLFYT